VIGDPQGTVLAIFATFCRVGTCVMIMPGFGSLRVPPQIRLFLALALSMAVLPMMWSAIYPRVATDTTSYLALIGGELLIGATLGFIARLYVLALQFAGVSMSMLSGFNSMSSTDLDEGLPQTELATLINTIGLLLLFILGFHRMVITALVHSYDFMPVGHVFDARGALTTLTDTLSKSFMVALQLSSPFIVYGLIFNFAVGLINKLAPQIPIYFISLPFLLAGGLILLYFGSSTLFDVFANQFPVVFNGQ